jgi:hypothetical protein
VTAPPVSADLLLKGAKEVELLATALDHMTSTGVSGDWRQRWPQQHQAVVARIVRGHRIAARLRELAEEQVKWTAP